RTGTAGVFLNQVEPLDGNEQLVVAVIAEFQKFVRALGASAYTQLFETDELANPMIDVNDQVAHLQVTEVGEKRLRQIPTLLGRVPFFLEDICFGVDLECRV